MSKHDQHKDGFIPKYLLKKLADRGNEDAKRTLVETEKIEKKIEEIKKNNEMRSLLIERTRGQSRRWIYDSGSEKLFKRKLVRKEGEPPVQDEIVNIAYNFCGKTLDYFKSELGRSSIDNNGMEIICNVHFGEGFNNAIWVEGMNQLALGDGDGRTFVNLGRSIEVVAHEMAHGVTQFVNNLEYERQSGALNEHFSDVIGTAVQQYVKGQTAQTADWLIGDEIVGTDWPGIALRSMKAPGTASEIDDQPANMRDYRDLPVDEDHDWGGVHIYSGIPNRAFFLTATEIGTNQAAFLWYNAWLNKEIIHPYATFIEAFEAIKKTAEALVEQGKLPQNTVAVVREAFQEVGILSLVLV